MAGAAPALRSQTDRRSSERLVLDRAGVLRVAEQSFPVRIADLTRDGCCIDADIELDPAARVTVGIAGIGSVPAQLVWRSDRGYGCAFDRSLHPGAVTAAFSPSNVARFPDPPEPSVVPQRALKLSGRARLAIVAGSIAASWALVAAVVAGVLTSGGFGR